MEAFSSGIALQLRNIESSVQKTDELMKKLEGNLGRFIITAKETLKKKHVINPKPQKRIMRNISEENTESEKEEERAPIPKPRNVEPVAVQEKSPQKENLRPVRTAKSNASKNLKEVPINVKQRNDKSIAVVVKTERVSTASKSNESTKENTHPNNQNKESLPANTVSKVANELNLNKKDDIIKRSMSVEIVPTKNVEIDITDEKDSDKMPPPSIPIKKKKPQKQSSQEIPVDSTQPIPVRITRSKIKKEKTSLDKASSAKELSSTKAVQKEMPLQCTTSESALDDRKKIDETTISKKGGKKKYPMPIIIKLERESIEETPLQDQQNEEVPNEDDNNDENIPPPEVFNKPSSSHDDKSKQSAERQNMPMNETVTINTNIPANQTITLANNVNETYNKNVNDSLMTEDNDEDISMEVPLSQLNEKKDANKNDPPQLPLKLKKNQVFNPYVSSPVKQKIQAYEKHVVNTATPDKPKAISSKLGTLKAGTPSKIALYSAKTTPLNSAKQKYIAATSGSASTSSASSSTKQSNTKKPTSLSHESNDDLRKNQAQLINQQLEEKKRQREEKQRQVQLQREAIEKQKREQTLLQQREREEKFRKIMQEKEEAKKLEALKKKIQKENQEKKYAEEKAKKEEFPKEPQSASKDDSLYVKMQKQIIAEKKLSQKKQVDKNTYCIDMLNTDDSTDDESHPSKKRPEPPQWSKKQNRQKLLYVQSYTNADLLDTLFSSQPISVNLKEIFPTIDARKLVRNSSAVWNTPPRYSQIPKY